MGANSLILLDKLHRPCSIPKTVTHPTEQHGLMVPVLVSIVWSAFSNV
jgi:hypothetical protein